MTVQAPAVPNCPACKSALTRLLGPSSFVGFAECQEVADLRALSGGLYVCRNCDLIFRWPSPDSQALDRAYKNIPITSWPHVEPPYWKTLSSQIKKIAPNRRVLDVGCFRGDFLLTLGPTFELFGIEPNTSAAETAAKRGIKIIGADARDDLKEYNQTFGAIVLMDVMEHLHDPLAMLASARELLVPGGLIVILTGDSTYWLARASLPFYWYMAFPIHLVYLGNRFIRWAAGQQQFEVIEILRTPHKPVSPRKTIGALLRAILIMSAKRSAVLRLFGPFKRFGNESEPRLFFELPDHMIAVLRKIG